MNFEHIKEHYDKRKDSLDSIFYKKCEARVKDLIQELTGSGFDADNYMIGMGTEYIGELGSLTYDLYSRVTETVYLSQSSISGDWAVRNKYYQEILDSINHYNSTIEEENGEVLIPVISEYQFDLILEFKELSQFMQYDL